MILMSPSEHLRTKSSPWRFWCRLILHAITFSNALICPLNFNNSFQFLHHISLQMHLVFSIPLKVVMLAFITIYFFRFVARPVVAAALGNGNPITKMVAHVDGWFGNDLLYHPYLGRMLPIISFFALYPGLLTYHQANFFCKTNSINQQNILSSHSYVPSPPPPPEFTIRLPAIRHVDFPRSKFGINWSTCSRDMVKSVIRLIPNMECGSWLV